MPGMFDDLIPAQSGGMFDDLVPNPQTNTANPLWDVVKQAGSGLVTGTEAIASTPAQLAALGGRAVEALAPGIVSPEAVQQQNALRDLIAANRGEGIANYLPKPETKAGERARYIAGFVPSTVAMPGGIARNAAIGVASGAGARAGDELTGSPLGELAGGLLGGVAASRALAPRAGKAVLPNVKQMEEAAKPNYAAADAIGAQIAISDDQAKAIVENIKRGLPRSERAQETHRFIDEFLNKETRDLVDLNNLRKNVRDQLTFGKGEDKGAASIALPRIKNILEGMSPEMSDAIVMADLDWAAAQTLKKVDKRMVKAERRAAGEGSGMNLGNKIRQNVTSMVESNREGVGFKPDELAQAERIIGGTRGQNLLRAASNMAGGGGGIGVWAPFIGAGSVGGAYASGNPDWLYGAAIPAAGFAARGLYSRSVAKQARKLGDMVASRSSVARTLPQPAALPSPVVPGLLGGAVSTTRGLLATPEGYPFYQAQ